MPKQTINRKALTTAITAAIIASTQVSQVMAQDQNDDASGGGESALEEVIVTANAHKTFHLTFQRSAVRILKRRTSSTPMNCCATSPACPLLTVALETRAP